MFFNRPEETKKTQNRRHIFTLMGTRRVMDASSEITISSSFTAEYAESERGIRKPKRGLKRS